MRLCGLLECSCCLECNGEPNWSGAELWEALTKDYSRQNKETFTSQSQGIKIKFPFDIGKPVWENSAHFPTTFSNTPHPKPSGSSMSWRCPRIFLWDTQYKVYPNDLTQGAGIYLNSEKTDSFLKDRLQLFGFFHVCFAQSTCIHKQPVSQVPANLAGVDALSWTCKPLTSLAIPF